jgi:hypothetical protein
MTSTRTRAGRIAALLIACIATMAQAGPGAHGPNGEHLDGPAGTVVADDRPRVEANSESFELVARLEGERLHVFVDEYETNAPVLGGSLEVESGPLKAKARFDAERGDYVVDDPKLIAAIRGIGEHPLVFTIITGDESDLLEGKLIVAAEQHDHAATRGARFWVLVALALLAAGALLYAWRRRRRTDVFAPTGEPT